MGTRNRGFAYPSGSRRGNEALEFRRVLRSSSIWRRGQSASLSSIALATEEGLAHSKTRRNALRHRSREAPWTAVALYRFSLRRDEVGKVRFMESLVFLTRLAANLNRDASFPPLRLFGLTSVYID